MLASAAAEPRLSTDRMPALITPRSAPALWQALVAGTACFDRAAYWDAHEEWETGWRASDDPDRDFLKGLIQFAAVQHHLQRAQLSAARALLARDRISVHLGTAGAARWPLPGFLLMQIAACQHAALAAGRPLRHTALRLRPWLGAVEAMEAGGAEA